MIADSGGARSIDGYLPRPEDGGRRWVTGAFTGSLTVSGDNADATQSFGQKRSHARHDGRAAP
ncbi:protein of unknown function [Caballeronia sp. S22]